MRLFTKWLRGDWLRLSWLKLDERDLKVFRDLTILAFLFVLPIILADRYYLDDIGRSISGYVRWEAHGRFVTALLAMLMHFGAPLQDISPLGLLLSLPPLTYSLTLFSRRFMPGAGRLARVLTSAFVFLNLFMIQNLSYKYDSFSMNLSIAVIFLFYGCPEVRSSLRLFVMSLAAVFLSLCLYQAALGMFFILLLLECGMLLYDGERWGTVGNTILMRTLGAGVSCALCQILSVEIFVNGSYPIEHSELVPLLSSPSESLKIILTNADRYFGYYVDAWLSIPLPLRLLLLAALAAAFSQLAQGYMRHKPWTPFRVIGCSLLCIGLLAGTAICCLILPILPLIVFKSPVFDPRLLLSFCGVSLVLGLALYYLSRRHRWVWALTAVCILFGLSFYYTYGNALKSQRNYDEYVFQSVARDVEKVVVGKKLRHLVISGRMPVCRELSLATSKFPLIRTLVPIYFSNNWKWGHLLLSHYLPRLNFSRQQLDDADLDYLRTAKPDVYNALYMLFTRDRKLVLRFSK